LPPKITASSANPPVFGGLEFEQAEAAVAF